jgi:hypothetical protein
MDETDIIESFKIYNNTGNPDVFYKIFNECELSKLNNDILNKVLITYLVLHQRYRKESIHSKIFDLIKLPEFILNTIFFENFDITVNEIYGFNEILEIYINSGKLLDESFITSYLSKHLETIYLKFYHKYIKITNETIILFLLYFGEDYQNTLFFLREDLQKIDTVSDDLLNIMIQLRQFENPHRFNDDTYTKTLYKDNVKMYEYLVTSKKIIPTFNHLKMACGSYSSDLVDLLISYQVKPTRECLDVLINETNNVTLEKYCTKYNINNRSKHRIYVLHAQYIVDKLCSNEITLNVKDVTELLKKNVEIKDFYKYNIIPDDELFETCLNLEKCVDYFRDFEFTQHRTLLLLKKTYRLVNIKQIIGNKNIEWNIEHLKVACEFSPELTIKFILEQGVKPDIECLHLVCGRDFSDVPEILDDFFLTIEPDIECLRKIIMKSNNKYLKLTFNMIYSKLLVCDLSNRLFEIKKPIEEKCMISLTDLHGHQYEECSYCHKPYLLEYIMKWLCIENKCPNCQQLWKWNDKVFIYL